MKSLVNLNDSCHFSQSNMKFISRFANQRLDQAFSSLGLPSLPINSTFVSDTGVVIFKVDRQTNKLNDFLHRTNFIIEKNSSVTAIAILFVWSD